jgi:hypothetical protein
MAAISPVFASAEADFAALLRDAINQEDECDEHFPGKISSQNDLFWAHLLYLGAVLLEAPIQADAGLTVATQSRQHKKRRIARDNAILIDGYHLSQKPASRKHLKNARVVKAPIDTASLPVASGAHTALNKPAPQNPTEVPEIQHLIQSGFKYVPCGENGYASLVFP